MNTLIRNSGPVPVPDIERAAPRRIARPRCGIDLMDAIYKRQSMRWYTPHQIEPEHVRALLDAAVQAPSAANLQPWAFVVVQDQEMLQHLSDRVKSLTLARMSKQGPLWRQRSMLVDPQYNVFYDAPTLILICARKGTPFAANEDCCLAAQNLMLAAHGMGLGTCPIGFARAALNDPDLRHALSIGDDHEVVMPIAVGYPREIPAPDPRDEPRILSWK